MILGEHRSVVCFEYTAVLKNLDLSCALNSITHTLHLRATQAVHCHLLDNTLKSFKRFCKICKIELQTDSILRNIVDLSSWLHKARVDPTWRYMNYRLLLAFLQGTFMLSGGGC